MEEAAKHRNTIMIYGNGNETRSGADSLVLNTLFIQRSGKIKRETRTKIRRSGEVYNFLSPVIARETRKLNKKFVRYSDRFIKQHGPIPTSEREVSAQQRGASEGQEDGKADTRPASG